MQCIPMLNFLAAIGDCRHYHLFEQILCNAHSGAHSKSYVMHTSRICTPLDLAHAASDATSKRPLLEVTLSASNDTPNSRRYKFKKSGTEITRDHRTVHLRVRLSWESVGRRIREVVRVAFLLLIRDYFGGRSCSTTAASLFPPPKMALQSVRLVTAEAFFEEWRLKDGGAPAPGQSFNPSQT